MTTQQEYARRMAAYARGQSPELTDLQPGSIYRSILEALAQQLELIQAGMLEEAQGSIREAAYRLWAFDRRPAVAASGIIRITATATISTSILLAAGTQVRVPGTDKVYRTTQALTFPPGAAGSHQDAVVAAIGAGSLYNTAANTIREFVVPPTPDLSVANPVAFASGRDEESDDERLQRFATYIRSLQRATAESIAYGAGQATITDGSGVVIERVAQAKVVDLSEGLARCYVANGTTAQASAELLAAANAYVQAYKAAGVSLSTLAASVIPVVVSAALTLAPTHSLAMVQASVEAAIGRLLADLEIGELLYVEQLDAAILSVPGVINVVRTAPAANVDPGADGIAVLTGVNLT